MAPAVHETRQPFDLLHGPLLRLRLLQLAPAEHVLLLTMHHIICDGWSIGVFLRETAQLYEAFRQGRASPLQDLPIQYADLAIWQRELARRRDPRRPALLLARSPCRRNPRRWTCRRIGLDPRSRRTAARRCHFTIPPAMVSQIDGISQAGRRHALHDVAVAPRRAAVAVHQPA